MITDDAIKAVYKKLIPAVSAVPVYQYARPANCIDPAYFVINALPIGSGILQKCIINVNAYCDDVAPGVPDSLLLATMTNLIISTLDQATAESSDIFFFYQQQNVYRGEELKDHYSNMRFEIRLLNN